MLPPTARVTTSMLSGFQETLESDLHTGEADTPPAGSPLAAITGPFLMSPRQFHTSPTYPPQARNSARYWPSRAMPR